MAAWTDLSYAAEGLPPPAMWGSGVASAGNQLFFFGGCTSTPPCGKPLSLSSRFFDFTWSRSSQISAFKSLLLDKFFVPQGQILTDCIDSMWKRLPGITFLAILGHLAQDSILGLLRLEDFSTFLEEPTLSVSPTPYTLSTCNAVTFCADIKQFQCMAFSLAAVKWHLPAAGNRQLLQWLVPIRYRHGGLDGSFPTWICSSWTGAPWFSFCEF